MGHKMSNGSLLLFVNLGLLLIAELTTLGDIPANVNNTNGLTQANADLGTAVASPLFVVFGYIAFAVAQSLYSVFSAIFNSFNSIEYVGSRQP